MNKIESLKEYKVKDEKSCLDVKINKEKNQIFYPIPIIKRKKLTNSSINTKKYSPKKNSYSFHSSEEENCHS